MTDQGPIEPRQDPPPAAIPAGSEPRAREWGLVLSSQAIESTLVHTGDGRQWYLLVDAREERRALEAIGLYRAETHRWRWRQEFVWPRLVFHWGALPWWLGMVLFHLLEALRDERLHGPGRVDPTAVFQGAWWRLFTAVTLHADIAHLAGNAALGFVLLGLAMARFGYGWALLAAYLAGAAGNLFSLLVSLVPHYSLGASGMVMGALGLLAAPTPGHPRPAPLRLVYAGLLTGGMLFILLGTNPNSDVAAHLGGFLAGLLQGFLLAWVPQARLERPAPNLVATLAVLALVLWTWVLALR